MSGDVEYLGPEHEPQPQESRSGRRWGLVAAGTVGVLAVAGVSAWGVTQYLSGGGPGAATAVPADALAYLTLDLDPDAGQKVEAYQTLRKFPAIDERLGSGDDLRRSIVEALLSEAPCDDLTFEEDFDPWLGDRMAVSVVPGGGDDDEPVPFVVVQVTDPAEAEDGVQAITECGGESETAPGVAFTEDDYMILAEDDETAASVVDDAASASLADDDGYQRWVGEAGGEGIVTAYLSAAAPQAFFDAMQITEEDFSSSTEPSESGKYVGRVPVLTGATPPPEPKPGELPSDFPTELLTELPSDFPTEELDEFDEDFGGPDMGMGGVGGAEMMLFPWLMFAGPGQFERAFEDFEGAAVAVRFDDGALEVETATSASDEVPDLDADDSGMADLPGSTAAAFGFGVSDTLVEDLLDGFAEAIGQEQYDRMLIEAERETGLSLPEDLQTLLGDGVSVALDSSVEPDVFESENSEDLPVAVRIVGDPDEIVPIVEQLVATADADDDVVVESGDGVVAVGTDPEHVAEVAQQGDLGDQEDFTDALPGLADSAGGLYVDFDAGDWLTELVGDDEGAQENLAPLRSLGITAQTDDDVAHGLLRLSTD